MPTFKQEMKLISFPRDTWLIKQGLHSTYIYYVSRTKTGKYEGLLEGESYKDGVPFGYVRGFEDPLDLLKKMQESHDGDIVKIVLGDE
jgi:hypothetical protein